MTSPPEERYTIVERDLAASVVRRFPEMAGQKTYRVFDNLKGAYVPFGSYGSRERAQGRITALKARDGAVEGA